MTAMTLQSRLELLQASDAAKASKAGKRGKKDTKRTRHQEKNTPYDLVLRYLTRTTLVWVWVTKKPGPKQIKQKKKFPLWLAR